MCVKRINGGFIPPIFPLFLPFYRAKKMKFDPFCGFSTGFSLSINHFLNLSLIQEFIQFIYDILGLLEIIYDFVFLLRNNLC